MRIGMSAAKGIAQSLSIPIIPVPTFEALAFQISSYLTERLTLSSFQIKLAEMKYILQSFKLMGNNYIFKEELKIIPV
ncbi:MAG: hypothetical protein MZV64_46895 [Ignavibacteriales bacterium]|nr:hypothetical protein [Ignavibacteriales bacterium]